MHIDKATIKAFVLSTGLLLLVIGIPALFVFNYLGSTQQFMCQGKFIEERPYFVSTDTGTKGGIRLFFKLDSGEIVRFKKILSAKAVEPGDRVDIYYRQGAVFKNKVYDRYEPLKTPQRFWTASELAGIQ